MEDDGNLCQMEKCSGAKSSARLLMMLFRYLKISLQKANPAITTQSEKHNIIKYAF